MEIPGFSLLLQDFCAYCPDFEPEIEKSIFSSWKYGRKTCTNIRCVNRAKCANIAERLERRAKNDGV